MAASRNSPRQPAAHSRRAAASAGLRYVSDETRGIRRRRHGQGFHYVGPSGKAVRDPRTLARIRSLAIPPAWEDVWICPQPNGHLQATGRDARGRKQFRYHPRWREVRDEAKYERMVSFAESLPRIRRKVKACLRRRGLPREKVLAAVVRLLETTLIRVGNDEYAHQNGSYGLTTLRNHQVEVKGARIRFDFRGKSGIDHEIEVEDSRLAPIVRRCQDLPGQELFGYRDEDGKPRDVTSTDVNDFLREISGHDFTAKDFRTWAGTALAAQALQEFEHFDSQAAAKRNITAAIERVASQLGNTKTVCRKCYVHPAILEAYLDHDLAKQLKRKTESRLRSSLKALSAEEAAVLAFLKDRLEKQAEPERKPRRRSRRH